MLMINELIFRQALVEGQIVPYFQPQFHLKTGRASGFEALARWEHPEYGVVLPSAFIPLAERSGLMGELTEVLFARAAAVASSWPEEITLSVNISPSQLRDSRFPDRIHGIAGKSGLLLSRLILEITESMPLENLALVRPLAERLKELGIRLALDDFGTGFSSLYYLQACQSTS